MNRHIISKILNWIDDRWPLKAVIRWGLEEEMPGGTSYAYVFGKGEPVRLSRLIK